MIRLSRTGTLFLLGLTMCGLTVVGLISNPGLFANLTYAAEAGKALAAKEQLETATDLSQAFRHVAKSLRPSVVSISSVRRIQPMAGRSARPRTMPDELRRFFGNDFFGQFQFEAPSPPRQFEQHGLGTGVIVASDGYILTNNHVVANADELKITLSDKRTYTAEVVGTDKPTDLAVLKIDATDLVAAELGDSTSLEVGEWALAIGSPFGLEQTVTAGIISATGRANVGIADYEDFVQTDAAINPGNSGGPLVNLKGKVIGINTAIASRSGGYMGVGFAIPSAMVKTVMQSLIDSGQVERGWLGAVIQDLSEDLAESFGYEGTEGVLIGNVVPGAPAEKAGLKAGDIVMRFNGKAMADATQLRNAVAATNAGTDVEVLVHREGTTETVTVHIEKLKGDATELASGKSSISDLGVTVQTLDAELAARLGYDNGIQGVVVTSVEPGSVAASLGIRPKDIIMSIGRMTIENIGDFRDALNEHNLELGIRLQVMRDGASRFLFARVGK